MQYQQTVKKKKDRNWGNYAETIKAAPTPTTRKRRKKKKHAYVPEELFLLNICDNKKPNWDR